MKCCLHINSFIEEVACIIKSLLLLIVWMMKLLLFPWHCTWFDMFELKLNEI